VWTRRRRESNGGETGRRRWEIMYAAGKKGVVSSSLLDFSRRASFGYVLWRRKKMYEQR
jgi:hypothetical protein